MSQWGQKGLQEDAAQLGSSLSQPHNGSLDYLTLEAGMKRTRCVVSADHFSLGSRELKWEMKC